MQTFVEQHVGALRHVFPGRELARLQLGAQPRVVLDRLFIAVDVVTLLAAAGAPVGLEQIGEGSEVVGLGAEVAERVITRRLRLLHGGLEFDAVQAVETVALDHRSLQVLTGEDMLEGALDGSGAGAGRTGHHHDGVLLGHE